MNKGKRLHKPIDKVLLGMEKCRFCGAVRNEHSLLDPYWTLNSKRVPYCKR